MHVIVIGGSISGAESVRALVDNPEVTSIDWFEAGDLALVQGWGANAAMHLSALAQQGVTVHNQTTVTQLNPATHSLTATTGASSQDYSYDKLILSTGSAAIELPLPGAKLDGVMSIAHRSSIFTLKKQVQNPDIKNVVIVGAGYIGVMFAEPFNQAGKHVTVVDIADQPVATNLDSEFSSQIAANMTESGVTLALGEGVQEFIGQDGHVTAVRSEKGTYPADLVIVAVGNRANTAWLQGIVDLDSRGVVKTDAYMRTSDPDILAVGDATTVNYLPTDTELRISLASNAARGGRFAGRYLGAPTRKFPGVSGTSALEVFGKFFAATGLSTVTAGKSGAAVASSFVTAPLLMADAPATMNAEIQFKLIYDPTSRRVLGAQLLSDVNVTAYINVVALAIQAKMTVEDLEYADFFFQPSLAAPINVINEAELAAN
ncbi:FAD-dependent oxidoreductase [Lacticaseibacillus pabuli]|uniref:FAD-dependent oxidoreductase n=1 Tax=Lacticaseibacillus pabuli TaxID=3025672 RepID=A0ABY7WTT6_9LACO|nr:FAD-dependent oxidoreductase [Lacticaseibacillus sp. KACC 23028]WDF83565.1 FAD-dependent oxidoreductase [Lacticaseibacillus sp. KACC 23028]